MCASRPTPALPAFGLSRQDAGSAEKPLEAFESLVARLHQHPRPLQLVSLAAAFREVEAPKTQAWLAPYYHATALVLAACRSDPSMPTGPWLAQAQEALHQLAEMPHEASERHALQALAYGAHARLSPMLHGPRYLPLAFSELDMALRLDPQNPQAYYVKGVTLYHLPVFWGGGRRAAKAPLQKAKSLFARRPPTLPAWSQLPVEELLRQC
jgi:hypothetical protein